MKLTTIKQSRGAAIRFRGECIASTSFDSRGGPMMLEIWETERRALIPVTRGETPNGRPDVRAAIVRLVDGADAPTLEMRLAVMDFFEWADRARSMVRDQLKWSLLIEVP